MDAKTAAWVRLHALGVGQRAWRAIHALGVERCQEEAAWRPLAPRAKGREPRPRVLAELDRFEAQGGVILGPAGAADLGRLVRAPHAPLCVYARGRADLVHRAPSVAIVGPRRSSARGRRRAREIAMALARAGVLVVSGGAVGVDMAAHEGALEAGGETVFVLGQPVGRADERAPRIRALCEGDRWLSLTPHGPWTRRSKGLFVSRNRLIAALADAVLVVEGREGSGTRHTARYAREIGVPVLAVPGDPEDALAFIPNQLIARGLARPYLGLEDLGVLPAPPARSPAPPTADPAERAVLAALEEAGGSLDLDALLARGGPPLLAATARLELAGAVTRAGARLERA